MSFFKKIFTDGGAAADSGDSSMFGVTVDQITKLMELRGKELVNKLNSSEYNGITGLLDKLKVDRNKGLNSKNEQDLQQRRKIYGTNKISPLQGQFSLSPADWIQHREYRHAHKEHEKNQRVTVLRDGHMQEIAAAEIVVGDICFVKSGDILTADGLIIQATDLKVDESTITGENNLVTKNENDDVALISETKIMEGTATILAIAVGPNSQAGILIALLGAKMNE